MAAAAGGSSMSTSCHNWGDVVVDTTSANGSLQMRDGRGSTLLAVPLTSVAHITGTKADVSIDLQPPADDSAKCYVSSIRLAVPLECSSYDAATTDVPAKALVDDISSFLRSKAKAATSGGAAAAGSSGDATATGVRVGVFHKLQLSQPSGLFDLTVNSTSLVFESAKSTPLVVATSNINLLCMLDIPGDDSKYLVLLLSAPIKHGATVLQGVVLIFDNTKAFDESSPWQSALTTEAEIAAVFPPGPSSLITPSMSGPACEVVAKVLKTVTGAKLFGDNDKFRGKEFSDGCAIRASHRGTEGLLYVLKNHLLFLHKPATFIAYADIDTIAFAGATGSFASTISFDLRLKSSTRAGDKLVFGGILKKEVSQLVTWLQEHKVTLTGVGSDEPDDEEEEDDDDDDEDADASGEEDEDDDDDGDSDDDDDDEDDDDDDDDERPKKKPKKESAKKEKKHKKEKKDKKHKKEKKDKKHKKEKKDKKDKKDKKAE